MRVRSCVAVLCFVALSLTGCATLRDLFNTVHVAMGVEQGAIAFFTHKSGIVRSLRPISTDVDGQAQQLHNETDRFERGFFTINSPPTQIPLLRRFPLLNYISFSFTIRSPQVFRGTLLNYPDLGIKPDNPLELLLLETYDAKPPIARRMDYLFEELQMYVTVYVPYVRGRYGFLGIGVNIGAGKYTFELHEGNIRIAATRNHWRPLRSLALTGGLNLKPYVRKGSFFSDVHAFLEVTVEQGRKHPIHVDYTYGVILDPADHRLIPANIRALRYDLAPPPSLYLNSTFVRFGIRKAIELRTPRQPPPKQTKQQVHLASRTC